MNNILIYFIKIILLLILNVKIILADTLPSQISYNGPVGSSDKSSYYIDSSKYNITSTNDINNYYLASSSCLISTSYSEITDPNAQKLFLYIAKSTSMLNPAAEGSAANLDTQGNPIANLDGSISIKCNKPNDDTIKICYTPASFDVSNTTSQPCSNNIITLCAGPNCSSNISANFGGIPARSVYSPVSNNTCIEVLIPQSGWKALGCKSYAGVSNGVIENNSCILSSKCMTDIQSNSKTFMSVTGVAYTCFSQTINNIMNEKTLCFTQSSHNSLSSFQKYMQFSVHILLILYVIFYGINIVLGEIKSLPEITLFIFKILFVMYFSVGFDFSGNLSNNGVKQLYDYGIALANGFANIVIQNSAFDGLCNIPKSDPYATGFEYLRLWDYLDCTLFFNFGMVLKAAISYFIQQLISNIIGLIAGPIGIILQIIETILSFNQILLAMVMFSFFGLVLSAIGFILEIFMKSIIAIAVLTFVAPIFVPMLLFNATKSMFEQWLSMYLSIIIQPAITIAYLPLMLIVFSGITFSNCKISSKAVDKPQIYTTDNTNNKAYVFYIDPNSNTPSQNACQSSPGYPFAPQSTTVTFDIKDGFIYSWQELFDSVKNILYAQGTLKPTIILFIIGYMFNFISMYTGSLAADLTNSTVNLSTRMRNPSEKFARYLSSTQQASKAVKDAGGFGVDIVKAISKRKNNALEVTRKSTDNLQLDNNAQDIDSSANALTSVRNSVAPPRVVSGDEDNSVAPPRVSSHSSDADSSIAPPRAPSNSSSSSSGSDDGNGGSRGTS